MIDFYFRPRFNSLGMERVARRVVTAATCAAAEDAAHGHVAHTIDRSAAAVEEPVDRFFCMQNIISILFIWPYDMLTA